nr:AEC family transporter [Propionibacterium sp.]
MLQALTGFGTIWLVIGLGWLLAHSGIVGSSGQALLNRLAFVAASPALLFTLVAEGSLDHLFSRSLIASVAAVAATIGLYLALNAWRFRHSLGGTTIGWMCAAYTNAGNLGLPVAQHVLGDMTWMAPILLLQVGLLQPFALASLDIARARAEGVRLSPVRYLSLPFRNPITAGILLGLVVNLAHLKLPEWLAGGIGMVGGMAVPMMLIAFGVSLRLDPLPGAGPHASEVWTLQALKILVMPALAIGSGALLGLGRPELFAVGVIAALPTAQNIFVISSRYHESMPVARDCVFWSTILTVPAILALSVLLG